MLADIGEDRDEYTCFNISKIFTYHSFVLSLYHICIHHCIKSDDTVSGETRYYNYYFNIKACLFTVKYLGNNDN